MGARRAWAKFNVSSVGSALWFPSRANSGPGWHGRGVRGVAWCACNMGAQRARAESNMSGIGPVPAA